MDFGKAFVYMFEDPEWVKKLAIGTLVGLLGIVLSPVLIGVVPLLMLAGYTLDVLRNVIEGRSEPLPEWEDWGGFFVRGFKLLAALFVWALPIVVAAIPMALGAALADRQDSSAAVAFGATLLTCGTCLILLWALFLTLISPAIYIRLAYTGRLAAAFEVNKVWALTRDNLGNVILAILLTWVAGLVAAIAAPIGLLFVCIGVLVTIPLATLWQYLVQAHLFGQIGRYSVTPIE